MNDERNKLASNIKVLREEARLTIEEFAERANVSVETAKAWEAGTLRPYTKDLMVICPLLRIHEEDLLERDIALEREDAARRMKHGSSRSNFDWYYGSRKKIVFYLLAVILIPLVGVLTYFVVTSNSLFEEMLALYKEEGLTPNIILKYYYITYPYIVATICGSVFMIIEIVKRFRQYFRVWYIFLAISFSSLLMIAALICLVPFYGYCIYQLIIKRGKN